MKVEKIVLVTIVFILSFCLPSYSVFACTKPVFKYAMEMWEQDYYEGLVIYDGSLTAQEKGILETLQGDGSYGNSLNLSLQKFDIASDKRALKNLLGKEIPKQLPALVLWYPNQIGITPPFWSGSLSGEVVQKVIESPVSKEVGDHLLRGVPIVWVLVQSGDQKKDNDVIKFLVTELDSARKYLLDDPSFQSHFEHIIDKSDLFPLVIIPGKRKAENDVLLSTLMNYYAGSEEIEEPAIFPIFGRGRALGKLAGDELDVNTIQSVIAFLLNACSCQVKMANPGFDLLLSGDWNTLLSRLNDDPLRPVLAGIMPDTTVQYDYYDVVDLTGSKSSLFSSRIISTSGIIVGASILLLILASIIIIKRR